MDDHQRDSESALEPPSDVEVSADPSDAVEEPFEPKEPESDEERAARLEIERAAVREIREERKLLTPSKYGDYFVHKIAASLIFGVAAILAAGYWYGQHTDPCFEFKLETSLFLDDPRAWKVWDMDCSREKGYCECVLIPDEPGERLQCAAIEGKNEVFCVMLSTRPFWF